MKKLILLLLTVATAGSAFGAEHPKYGPYAIPLSKNPNRDYFASNKSPDFWALIPYYVPQENDSSCSAAALVTVLNAARRGAALTTADELVTHKSLTEKLTDEKYKASVSGDLKAAAKEGTRLGVPVMRLGDVLKEAATSLKIWNPTSEVHVIVIDRNHRDESRKQFHKDLIANEKSADDFIILNFTQGMLTGDPEGMVGHIAAVGGYDAKHKWVLILDPDRQWYEPYWSPEEKVFDAVADSRSDATPGYVYYKVK